jgi:purine-binding chemotaxis protein CheW
MATKTAPKLIDFSASQELAGFDVGPVIPTPLHNATGVTNHEPDNDVAIRYGFQIAGYHFMVPQNAGIELLKDPAIQPLPSAPEWICGLCNFHGEIIPVINMDVLLGSSKDRTDVDYALTIDNGDGPLAIIIDEMPGAIQTGSASSKQIETPEIFASYVANTYQIDGEIWFEVDINRLVAEKVDA